MIRLVFLVLILCGASACSDSPLSVDNGVPVDGGGTD